MVCVVGESGGVKKEAQDVMIAAVEPLPFWDVRCFGLALGTSPVYDFQGRVFLEVVH